METDQTQSRKMRHSHGTTGAGKRVFAGEIPRRLFGRSGVPVSLLGLGGSSLGAVRTEAEAIRIVHEALERAKKQGKVRFLSFTGHKHPSIHLKMLAHDFPFDACQLPLGVFDASFRSFEQRVLPELTRRGIAPIGIKSLGGTGNAVKRRVVTVRKALRHVMSLPIATLVSGIDSLKVLRQNMAIVRGFKPMKPAEMQALRRRCAREAGDGRFEFYKTSICFDGPPGREQHGFPPQKKVPA